MTRSSHSHTEIFSVLGSDVRIEIIQALASAGQPLSFSEIHARISIRDSGQFNYHLDKLLDSLVRQTEDGDYELTFSGGRFVGALYSGEFDPDVGEETIDLESTCPECAQPLRASYEHVRTQQMHIRCTKCETVDTRFGFPPGGLGGRSAEERTIMFDRWLRNGLSLVAAGICDNCLGRLSGGCSSAPDADGRRDTWVIEYTCERCPTTAMLSIGSFLYQHPDVIEFYRRNEVDLGSIHLWNTRAILDPTVTIRDEDPWEAEVTFSVEKERLVLRIDEALEATPLE